MSQSKIHLHWINFIVYFQKCIQNFSIKQFFLAGQKSQVKPLLLSLVLCVAGCLRLLSVGTSYCVMASSTPSTNRTVEPPGRNEQANSVSLLDAESLKNLENINVNSWVKSSFITEGNFFKLIQCAANGKLLFKCGLCENSKSVVAYVNNTSNLTSHMKVRIVLVAFQLYYQDSPTNRHYIWHQCTVFFPAVFIKLESFQDLFC